MKYCDQCGKENRDDARFCRYCGTKFRDLQGRVSLADDIRDEHEQRHSLSLSSSQRENVSVSESSTLSQMNSMVTSESLSHDDAESTSSSVASSQSLDEAMGASADDYVTSQKCSSQARYVNGMMIAYSVIMSGVLLLVYHYGRTINWVNGSFMNQLGILSYGPLLYVILWGFSVVVSIMSLLRFYKHPQEKVNGLYLVIGIINCLVLWYVSPAISLLGIAIKALHSSASYFGAMFGMMNQANMALVMEVTNHADAYRQALTLMAIVDGISAVVCILICLQIHKIYTFTSFFNIEE